MAAASSEQPDPAKLKAQISPMNRLATAIEPIGGSFFTDRICHHPSKYATANNAKNEFFLRKTAIYRENVQKCEESARPPKKRSLTPKAKLVPTTGVEPVYGRFRPTVFFFIWVHYKCI
jgi:hypothetical protein